MPTKSGRLVAVHGNTLIVADDAGTEHDCPIAQDAAITRNGVPVGVPDLHVGDKLELVHVPNMPATSVTARTV